MTNSSAPPEGDSVDQSSLWGTGLSDGLSEPPAAPSAPLESVEVGSVFSPFGRGWSVWYPVVGIVVALFSSTVAVGVATVFVGADNKVALVVASIVGLWCGLGGTAIRATGGSLKNLPIRVGLEFHWSDLAFFWVGVVAQFVVVVVSLPILRLLGNDNVDEVPKQMVKEASSAWLIALAFVLVVGAPIIEEIFFRGVLLGSLKSRGLRPVPSMLITGLVFSAAHLDVLKLFGIFLLGTFLSFLVVKFRRLGPSIATHMGFNATALAFMLLLRYAP